jgi:predicted transcriptional regulator
MAPCNFDRVSTIARIINRPKRYTRKLLKKLAEAGMIYIDDESDPDGKILYGTLPTNETIEF